MIAINRVRILLLWSMVPRLLPSMLCEDHGKSFTAALDEGEECARSPDLWPCLKKGTTGVLSALVSYQDEIPLMGKYLSLVPDQCHVQERGRQDDTSSPQSSPSSHSVYSKFLEFANGRLLRVSLPVSFFTWLVGVTSRTPEQEGRGKKDKGAGMLILGGMMLITTLMSTAFGALALMAAKGLFTSVFALMMSAMAISKKSGSYGHARTRYEVINAPQGYQQEISGYNMDTDAVVSEVSNNPAHYHATQTEPIEYGS
ncbi:uncharacterized protein LOC112688402 [Sipha flava]|uniref:Uncharacterized protein LOC112688402 n=1 Tax=Sipha flava TaxID=143950 RepID=A0A8B8G2Z6_9HEMI|nr:uncharacterized protein LOC112688402 [Sipha flava]